MHMLRIHLRLFFTTHTVGDNRGPISICCVCVCVCVSLAVLEEECGHLGLNKEEVSTCIACCCLVVGQEVAGRHWRGADAKTAAGRQQLRSSLPWTTV